MINTANIEIYRGEKLIKKCAKHRTAVKWLKAKGDKNIWRYTVSWDPLGREREIRETRFNNIPASAYVYSNLSKRGREAQEGNQNGTSI